MAAKTKKDPKVRCFDVVFGGGASESQEREGKTFWPHAIHLCIERVYDIEQMVKGGIDWLKENGAKSTLDREPFTADVMGEIVETDLDTGAPLNQAEAGTVTLRMPTESWALLKDTLEVDSEAASFDRVLRERIKAALKTVEVG